MCPSARAERVGCEQDRPGVGELFHARGQVRGLSHRGVVHAEVAADGAHDDVAGVEADPDADADALRPSHFLGVALHDFLHPQRGVARPDGVILVGERRAEEGHDPVAHHLVDGALVPVHGRHHELDHRIEDLARVLGIAVGEELHRALQIGEQHGDLLAFPLDGGLRGEDLLREVAGRVALGRRRRGHRPAERLPAAVAEAASRGFTWPQAAHTASSRAPQPLQKRAPEGLSWLHWGQRMATTPQSITRGGVPSS